MDLFSYLLGKNKGVKNPILQEKNVTITTNTTQTISADSGYDGLSSVEVTTNVSGGGISDLTFDGLTLTKLSTQNGTPSPDNPVAINTIKNNITLIVNENSNIVIPLGNYELCGISTFKDELIIDSNGHCYLNKIINKIYLNNLNPYYIRKTGTDNWYYEVAYSPSKNSSATDYDSLCPYFPANGIGNLNTNQGFCLLPSNLRIRYGQEESINDFWNWLDEQGFVPVYYPLESSTLIDLNYTIDTTLFNNISSISNLENGEIKLKLSS